MSRIILLAGLLALSACQKQTPPVSDPPPANPSKDNAQTVLAADLLSRVANPA